MDTTSGYTYEVGKYWKPDNGYTIQPPTYWTYWPVQSTNDKSFKIAKALLSANLVRCKTVEEFIALVEEIAKVL
jgi:hypothetical protein